MRLSEENLEKNVLAGKPRPNHGLYDGKLPVRGQEEGVAIKINAMVTTAAEGVGRGDSQ